MILGVRLTRSIRDVFSKGTKLDLKPLTVLVGDNGCGKSTFLHYLNAAAMNCDEDPYDGRRPPLKLRRGGTVLSSVVFIDFERDNCRVSNDGGIIGVFSSMLMSHGETMMDQFVHEISDLRSSLVLLDEPDQCLSPRSAYRLFNLLSSVVSKNYCQVVMSCHSVPMMEMAGEVLSLEHMKWMDYRDFLETQKEPATLRWVDDDEKFKEPAVLVRLSDGKSKYVSTVSDLFVGPLLHKSPGYARIFRDREAAQRKASSLIGKKVLSDEDFGSRKYATVESAEVVMLNRTFG